MNVESARVGIVVPTTAGTVVARAVVIALVTSLISAPNSQNGRLLGHWYHDQCTSSLFRC